MLRKGLRQLKSTMSCRIDRLVAGDHLVVLCISGRIRAQDLDMLRDLLGQESGAVAIDLKGVLLVDREVVKLLALSEANGIELRNCPAYIREWIAKERAQGRERVAARDGSKGGHRRCLMHSKRFVPHFVTKNGGMETT